MIWSTVLFVLTAKLDFSSRTNDSASSYLWTRPLVWTGPFSARCRDENWVACTLRYHPALEGAAPNCRSAGPFAPSDWRRRFYKESNVFMSNWFCMELFNVKFALKSTHLVAWYIAAAVQVSGSVKYRICSQFDSAGIILKALGNLPLRYFDRT